MKILELPKESKFEYILVTLFEQLGYKVEYQKKAEDHYIDMELTYQTSNKKEKYICDVKFYSKLYFSAMHS